MLGLGVLFISLYTGYATEAYSILFGEILGISSIDVLVTAIAALVILCVGRIRISTPPVRIARRRCCGSEGIAHAYAWNRFHALGRTCHVDCRSSSGRTSNLLVDGHTSSDCATTCQTTLASGSTVCNHLPSSHMVRPVCSILRALPCEFLHNNYRVRSLLAC